MDDKADMVGVTPEVAVVSTHIPPALGYGGVSVTAGILSKAWAKAGHHIVWCASDESMSGPLKPEDVQFDKNGVVNLYHSYWFRRWGFGFGAIPKTFSICVKARCIYIHGIATWPNTLAAVFSSILRRRFLVAPHGGLMPEHVDLIRRRKPHKWLYYKLFTLPTLRRAAAIHCTSETEARGVRELLGSSARVVIIPNGVAAREIQTIMPPNGGPGVTISFLGHVQREKGINGFIRAWMSCRRAEDRLIVAGRSVDRTYYAEFLELVEEAGGAIEYRGYVDRPGVMAILSSSHYLVLPSGLENTGGMRENFGNVVAEAMAASRPVLVAKGLAWDHVESSGTGFVFDRNKNAVCEVVERALTLDTKNWSEMSRKARRYVEEHLDADRLAQQVWNVLVSG